MIVVYFAYLRHAINWWEIVGGQLREIMESGILSLARLEIVIVGMEGDRKACRIWISDLLPTGSYVLTEEIENRFEYPGIHRLWSLASQSQDDEILLYMHSKGMSRVRRNASRTPEERRLTRHTLSRWREVPEIMRLHGATKVGLFPNEHNSWIWFNFFYIRASVLKRCREPAVRMDNRWYYESYIATDDESGHVQPTFSLFADSPHQSFTPHAACAALNTLPL